MVDSRQKGARAEAAAKKKLIELTGLNWERIPQSGALDKKHGLKGDLYVPQEHNIFCVEVKHYKDDHLTSKILTDKVPQLAKWWEQTLREAREINKRPLLLFKFDRSKWFVAITEDDFYPELHDRYIYVSDLDVYILTLESLLKKEKVKFIK